jgi:carbon-monoxide dehydrogenase medium subunit
MRWDKYFLAGSIDEAIFHLQAANGKGRIIGGGTDLIPQICNGLTKKRVRCLVDVTRIPDLRRIEFDGSLVSIGGAVTHSQLASSRLIRKVAQTLAVSSGSVGSPQIRNQGRLAGNIVNAHHR